MDSDEDSGGQNSDSEQMSKSTKRKKGYGRMTDVMKKFRLSSHEIGKDCMSKRYKCFENMSVEKRNIIIKEFNSYETYDKQSEYLGGLITVLLIQRRRNRKPHISANFNNCSYAYRVRVNVDGYVQNVPVCYEAFKSIHGISAKRVQTLKESLGFLGKVPSDG